MAFVKETTVKEKKYYDLVESIRVDGKPKHHFIAHIGTRKPTQVEVTMINLNLSGNDEIVVSKKILSKGDTAKINEFNKDISKKIKAYSELELENFKKKFNTDFIYNTNAIEGSSVTREEASLILETGQAVQGKTLREIHEVENMLEAIQYVEKYEGVLTENFLKELHAIVQKNIEKETLGKYKRIPNYVANYMPTHPIFVEKRVRSMLAWYRKNKNNYHPLELASIMHLKFVAIHPFTDGNGRVARLMHNFILRKFGFHSIIFPNDDKLSYYIAIQLAQEKQLKPFIEFVVKNFYRTYEEN